MSEIHIQLPADSLKFMLEQLINDRYMRATFVFDNGTRRDTIQNIGLRLRGNTSLTARKKSFKISFNEFESGRKYQGVKKLNLRGSHNDPTMIREKLFYEVWNKAGMPKRRAAFAKLYINGVYRGLYTNIEEIDKEWLGDVFDDDEGNLYKCIWPANLAYLGATQQPYKSLKNNETRAYELVTNEAEDDYARLVALITALNSPVDAGFPERIGQILNTDAVLKSFALDVATGNWDDYFYNKNNYYLYDHPVTDRFEFFTFDTDNTFGVDWLGVDWTMRNALTWQHPTDPRPLATKLLSVPVFKQKYVFYLDSITRFITHPDSIFPRIDALHTLITPAAETDLFRTQDYGYTVDDFHKGFDATVDGHTPYGIKPFLIARYQNTRTQLAPLVAIDDPEAPALSIQIGPNPVQDQLFISTGADLNGQQISCMISDLAGRIIKTCYWQAGTEPFSMKTVGISPGLYVAKFISQGRETALTFVLIE